MRQSWDLRPAGTVGRARLLFLVLTGLLFWLAWGRWGQSRLRISPRRRSPRPPRPTKPPRRPRPPAAPRTPPASTSSGDEGSRPPARENMLQWAIRASGPIGLFLLCLSIYFTALVIRLFMEFRVSEAVPAAAGGEARSRDPRQEVSRSVRRLQG